MKADTSAARTSDTGAFRSAAARAPGRQPWPDGGSRPARHHHRDDRREHPGRQPDDLRLDTWLLFSDRRRETPLEFERAALPICSPPDRPAPKRGAPLCLLSEMRAGRRSLPRHGAAQRFRQKAAAAHEHSSHAVVPMGGKTHVREDEPVAIDQPARVETCRPGSCRSCGRPGAVPEPQDRRATRMATVGRHRPGTSAVRPSTTARHRP